jgi:hypothetical protein
LIQIESRWEEEGPQEVHVEDGMDEKLGLFKEDERLTKATEEGCDTGAPSALETKCGDDLVCANHLPDDTIPLCDWRHSVMDLGCRYKDMATFWLAMRQYAIKKEFELGIEATSTTRYRGYCQGGNCPWKIHARVDVIGSPTVIVSFLHLYI